MYNFAIIGVGGYIAPRHLKAIMDTGNRVVAACDPNDSVGILDRYSLDIKFFKEPERFDRFLFKQHKKGDDEKVHFVSICTPNYLHDAHIRLALRNDCYAICEKPLVINPWNLDALKELEDETGKRVYTIMQLRYHQPLIKLKKEIESSKKRYNVEMTYITGRGRWYYVSWKGTEEYSGGVATNIGVHLFDLMIWLFGDVEKVSVFKKDEKSVSGFLSLKNADVRWFLSLDPSFIPEEMFKKGKQTYRSIKIDEEEIEFSEGFTDLHTLVYKKILNGEGLGIEDARKSIELVYKIRKEEIKTTTYGEAHPLVK